MAPEDARRTRREPVAAEQLRKKFHEAPDAAKLVELYAALREEGDDDQIARILDKVRPIQHRVTLVQADASPELLEVLCRDPHPQVRQVVASHANISTEVCLRLCEDQQPDVRLALRKNPHCHPVIQSALLLRERQGDREDASWEQLVEIVWQARRAEVGPGELVELIEDWTQVTRDDLTALDVDQANVVLDVLDAKLGKGPMPKKPRKKRRK